MRRFLGGVLVAQLFVGCSGPAPTSTPTPTPTVSEASTPRSAGPEVPGTADEAILAVSELTNQGDLKGAVALATASLEKYPDSYQLLANRGAILLHQEQFEPARDDFEKALKGAPAQAQWTILSQRARCYAGLNQKAAAEKDFAAAARLLGQTKAPEPAFVEQLWRLRAANLASDLRYKESLPCFDKALALRPDNPKTLAGRAMAYRELGDSKRFERDLTALDRLQPGAATALRGESHKGSSPSDELAKKGTLKLREGDYEGALALLDQALKADPKSAQAHQKRGSALQSLKRFPEAIDAYTRSYDLDHNEVALFNRSICYLNEKKVPEARSDLEEFVKISNNPEASAQARSLLDKL